MWLGNRAIDSRGGYAPGYADFRRNGTGSSLLLSFGPGCLGFFRSAGLRPRRGRSGNDPGSGICQDATVGISLLRRADDAFTVRGVRFTRGKAERSAFALEFAATRAASECHSS